MLMEDRKLEPLSSSPELDPGLLPVLEGPRLDPSDRWLDPGREERLTGRDGGPIVAGAGSKNEVPALPRIEGDEGSCDRVSMVLSASESRSLVEEVRTLSGLASSLLGFTGVPKLVGASSS